MRDIKFRAWDGGFMSYFPIDAINTNEIDGDPLYRVNGVTLMQYTGLKDKNGVDIYEGDIVAYHPDKPEAIQFIDGAFCFSSGWTLHDLITPPNKNKAEVIGNIYENPELLK